MKIPQCARKERHDPVLVQPCRIGGRQPDEQGAAKPRQLRQPNLTERPLVRGRAEAVEEPEALIRIYPERIVSWGLASNRTARTVKPSGPADNNTA